MLDAFNATLEACDPARGRFRTSRIDAGIDLLSDWLVDVTFGRIGARGRTIRHVDPTRPAPAKSSATACNAAPPPPPRCIGVASRLRELIDPGQWVEWNDRTGHRLRAAE